MKNWRLPAAIWTAMKISIAQLLLVCLFTGPLWAKHVSGQEVLDRKISVSAKNIRISRLLNIVSGQTKVPFLFSPEGIGTNRKVDCDISGLSLKDFLNQFLKPYDIDYKMVGEKVLLFASGYQISGEKETGSISENNSEVIIRGLVLNESGEPVGNASITVKGRREGTTSTPDGHFSLSVPEGPVTLLVSFIGYQLTEVIASPDSAVKVTLIQNRQNSYDTLVVVGYGTEKKRNLTTSVGSVNGSQLTERPTAINVLQGLQGKISGVSVLNNSGKPGGTPSVIIRGNGSVNASSSPLYVIDGIVGADPSILDPSIVQSMDVLKDAAATSIYGSRGANGVVIVTTKHGRKGNSDISFSHTSSFGTLQHELKLLDAKGALEMFKRTYAYSEQLAPNIDPANDFTRKAELFNADGSPKYNTDWQKEATRTAFSNNSSLTFSSGKDRLTSLVNVSYNDQQGIMLNSDLKRLNLFANISGDARPWLHVQTVLNAGGQQGGNVDLNLFGLNAIREMYEFLPFLPVKYADGTYSMKGDYPNAENSENPVKLLKEVHDQTGNIYGNGSFIITANLGKKLDLTTSWGGQLNAGFHNYYSDHDVFGYSLTQNGVAQRSNTMTAGWTNEDYVTYHDHFGLHNVNVVAGASWYYTSINTGSAGSENFFDDYFTYNSLQTGTVYEQPTSSRADYEFNSYYLRANYNYDDRYLLGASMRVDGSSRFGANNKYGYFPSVSGAWRISNEKFFGPTTGTVSNLKLRLSYGSVGNAEINNYASLNQLATAQTIFNGVLQPAVVLANNAGNANLKWERQKQEDVGLDIGLWKNHIELTADFYNKVTSDMLYQKQLPASSGYVTSFDNIGSVRNSGLEFSVTSHNIQHKHFTWSSTLNYSMNRSKILNLNGDIIGTWAGRLEKGRSMDEFYGYKRLKAWGSEDAAKAATYGAKPGDIHWADLNNDGVINAEDQTYLGHKMPRFEMNLTNTINIYNFTLYFDLQYLHGNKIMNFTRFITASETPQTNTYTYALNSWTTDHQDTRQGALRLGTQPNQNNVDDWNIEDASAFRIRNITVAYNFSPKWLQKMSFTKLSLSVTAENYFLFTKYTGYDPEVTAFDGALNQGVEVYAYPKPKTLAFNLNFTF